MNLRFRSRGCFPARFSPEMTSLPLSFSSHSRCFPMSSVSFLNLRPSPAPPPKPPPPPPPESLPPSPPPEPPDPLDAQICLFFGETFLQPPISTSFRVFDSLLLLASARSYIPSPASLPLPPTKPLSSIVLLQRSLTHHNQLDAKTFHQDCLRSEVADCLALTTREALFPPPDARSWSSAQELLHQQAAAEVQDFPPVPAQTTTIATNCFVDAAWSANGNCGAGWSFRDEAGHILTQHKVGHRFIGTALFAETFAMKLALVDAKSAGFHKLNVSSDCKALISLLKSGNSTVELRSLLHDIKELSVSFTFISFNFLPRLDNVFADNLAKSALFDVNSSSVSRG